MTERKDIMENESYNRLCIASTKDLYKATYYEGDRFGKDGSLFYIPCRGLASSFQRGNKDKGTELLLVLLEDYGTYYRDAVTGHLVAKGVPNNNPIYMKSGCAVYGDEASAETGAPLCLDENAKVFVYSEAEAGAFINSNPDYATKFNRLYASGLNAVNDYNEDTMATSRIKRYVKRHNG